MAQKKQDVKISIIIPVYQVSNYVERCLKSVIGQTFTDFECIIVNDATLDDSIEKCERLIHDYNGPIRFQIIHHEHNQGLSAARNSGTKAAKGEYIYYLDSDDEITPDCIEKLASKAMEEDSIEMVQGSHVRINKGEKELFVSENMVIIGNDEVRNHFLNWRNINYCAWNKLLKKSFIVENGLYFREGIVSEELLWTFYLIKHLKKACLCKDITYHYKLRPGSIVTGMSLVRKGECAVKVYDEILHNLTEGKERDELYGFLYNFCEVLANYIRCTPELKRILQTYKKLALKYGSLYVYMVLTVVATISRFGNPMGILKKLNSLRWRIKGKKAFELLD